VKIETNPVGRNFNVKRNFFGSFLNNGHKNRCLVACRGFRAEGGSCAAILGEKKGRDVP